MSFRLVPKSVTLNDLERRNCSALILRYFTEFGSSGANCIKVVEDVVVKKFTFAISYPNEFLVCECKSILSTSLPLLLPLPFRILFAAAEHVLKSIMPRDRRKIKVQCSPKTGANTKSIPPANKNQPLSLHDPFYLDR